MKRLLIVFGCIASFIVVAAQVPALAATAPPSVDLVEPVQDIVALEPISGGQQPQEVQCTQSACYVLVETHWEWVIEVDVTTGEVSFLFPVPVTTVIYYCASSHGRNTRCVSGGGGCVTVACGYEIPD